MKICFLENASELTTSYLYLGNRYLGDTTDQWLPATQRPTRNQTRNCKASRGKEVSKQEKLPVALSTVIKHLDKLSDAELHMIYFKSWALLMEREKENEE